MPTLEAIQPYVEQVFDDSDVQDQLRRAVSNLRGAKSRAGRAKGVKQAVKDPVLRARVAGTVKAAVAAGVAIGRGPQKQRRRSRRTRLLIVPVIGAAAYVATSPGARAQTMQLVNGLTGQEPTT